MTSNMPSSSKRNTRDSARKPRTIVLCFDGTSNEYGTKNTNVVKFYSLLKKDNQADQICYYQPGIGTYFQPGVVSPILHWGAAALDIAIAWYLSQHVLDGYKFLMQNYEVGDKVCLIGFSRGAYTARALAGMLHKIGLLSKDNDAQLPFAYKLYKSELEDSVSIAAGFKRTFCRPVPIEFIGVWDTVASVGLLTRRTLPFVTNNTAIRTFRHALALDERRAKFRASYYQHTAPQLAGDVQRPSTWAKPSMLRRATTNLLQSFSDVDEGMPGVDGSRPSFWQRISQERQVTLRRRPVRQPTIVETPEDVPTTNVREVWFAGGHADIGGGVASDTDEYSLADIPLRWMVHEAMRAQCGILFDSKALARLGIPTRNIFKSRPASSSGHSHPHVTLDDYLPPRRRAATSPTQERPHLDAPSSTHSVFASSESDDHATMDEPLVQAAKQPISDQLREHKSWWLLELIPTKFMWQSSDNNWITEWSMHLGAGRGIPDRNGDPPIFHQTVRVRMQDPELKYLPRALPKSGKYKWNDE
ncbi:hypothetical protein PENSPDRAFT_650993 [Peniophora sp. CONT]|nr:hypothetical protein PENSPDRAFT_650993 [Peniophora sp. CONT]